MAQPYPSRTGIYQLRRKVPLELQAALGRQYKRSLKKRDPKAAKGLFAEEWQRSEEAFALARAQAHGADTMGERDMQQLSARWFRAEQRAMEDGGDFAQWLVEGGHWTASQGDDSEEHIELVTLRHALDQDPDWSIAPQGASGRAQDAGGAWRP